MTTVADLLDAVAARLHRHLPRPEARAEARLIVTHATGIDRLRQTTAPETAIDGAMAEAALDLAERRAGGAPLAYLLGRREFWGLAFAVGPGVLVPRPDSETLVEAALAQIPAARPATILDLGTGSGCLLLAVLSERPLAWGLGVDRSADALAYARQNAIDLGLAARAALVRGDWWQALAGRFDLVLANPPYVPSATVATLMPEVRDHEPHAALDGGADGLAAYRALLAGLGDRLASGGLALFEIGHDQGAATVDLARAHGFPRARLIADLAGRDRCLVLTAA